MDKCQKCGQAICQAGYSEIRREEFVCRSCVRKERIASLFQAGFLKGSWAWLCNWIKIYYVVRQFVNTAEFKQMVESLSNRSGEFELESRCAWGHTVRIEYTNSLGDIEMFLYDFNYGKAYLRLSFDKFCPIRTMRFRTVTGGPVDHQELTKSVTELLKSGVEFEMKLCHC